MNTNYAVMLLYFWLSHTAALYGMEYERTGLGPSCIRLLKSVAASLPNAKSFAQPLNYSVDEQERTFLQQTTRFLLKKWTTSAERDRVGLGSMQEQKITSDIYNKIKNNTYDETTMRQFCERQQIATVMALTLTQELKKIPERPELSDSQIVAQILFLIQDANKLRATNKEYALSPIVLASLKEATKQVKENIKKLCRPVLEDENEDKDTKNPSNIIDQFSLLAESDSESR